MTLDTHYHGSLPCWSPSNRQPGPRTFSNGVLQEVTGRHAKDTGPPCTPAPVVLIAFYKGPDFHPQYGPPSFHSRAWGGLKDSLTYFSHFRELPVISLRDLTGPALLKSPPCLKGLCALRKENAALLLKRKGESCSCSGDLFPQQSWSWECQVFLLSERQL